MPFQMKHIVVLISFLLFIKFKGFAQEIVIPKDTIYLKYKPNDGSLPHYRGKKFKNKNGINFNLYKGDGLIYPKNEKSDTLQISNIMDDYITAVKDLDNLEKKWQEKTKPLLIKKYGIPYPNTTNKNNMFVTFLIEECGDYYIKYRVYWRHQKP